MRQRMAVAERRRAAGQRDVDARRRAAAAPRARACCSSSALRSPASARWRAPELALRASGGSAPIVFIRPATTLFLRPRNWSRSALRVATRSSAARARARNSARSRVDGRRVGEVRHGQCAVQSEDSMLESKPSCFVSSASERRAPIIGIDWSRPSRAACAALACCGELGERRRAA